MNDVFQQSVAEISQTELFVQISPRTMDSTTTPTISTDGVKAKPPLSEYKNFPFSYLRAVLDQIPASTYLRFISL
jgi:hypothetical protein